jgi:predicted nuclease with RNAse H fold
MITVGVDLASQSNDTALAVVEWGDGRSKVLRVVVGADDEMIVDEGTQADVIGIASPFGWPDPFFELLSQNRVGRIDNPRRAATVSGRDEIMYRTTERRVRDWLGLKLMPSTSNMLGSTVLRCAGLQTRLDEAGVAVTRGAGGRVIEVYSPASLMAWGLHEPSYKNQSASRVRILEQIGRRLSCYFGDYRTLCVESDDALDALVGAMTARAVALGFWRQPVDEEEQERASAEGWICVPSGTVETLLGTQPSELDERL